MVSNTVGFVYYISLFTHSKQSPTVNKATGLAQQAAEALARLAGVPVDYSPGTEELTLTTQGTSATFRVVEVRKITKAKLAELASRGDDENTVVVSEYVTPEQARQLREADVNYLDAAGNARLKAQGTIVLVEGQKPKQPTAEEKAAGRAFQPAGLKVLFTILVDPGRVNDSYRDLAERVDVSPAAVKYVLDDLERRGSLIKVGRGRGMSRRPTDVSGLAQRWANSYGDVLRPKLLRGRYRFLTPDQQRRWKSLTFEGTATCWGGEPAADLYAGLLRAERLTIYTTAATSDLARTLRIVPAADGPIEVLDKFWADDVETVDGQPVAPRLLVYADLLASGQTRNLETAQPLFDAWADASIDQQ